MRDYLRIAPIAALGIACSGCGDQPGSVDLGAIDLALPSDFADDTDLGWTGDLSALDLVVGPDMTADGCNSGPANTAPPVQQVLVAQPMPSPTTGGSIVSGTYYLTDSKIYQGGGTTPLLLQATQVISGTAVLMTQKVGTVSPDSFDKRTYSTSGTTLTITFECSPGTATIGYDATPTQYTTYSSSSKVVNVFTKQ